MTLKRQRLVERRGAAARRAKLIVEPELDMSRNDSKQSSFVVLLNKVFRWMVPGAKPVAAPMRSVARELEETFPSREH